MGVNVDVSGLLDFEDLIRQMANGFEGFLERFLLKEATRALAGTKRLTPVMTGYLRNSWQMTGIRRSGGYLIVDLLNPVEYASYVEYGHVTANRKGFVPGKYMSTISIKTVEAKMAGRYEREFRLWMQSLGRE